MVRSLIPADHNQKIITKSDKDFAKRSVKIRDIHKIEKTNYIDIRVFGYQNKEKHPIYVSKQCCKEKHVDLLLIGKTEKNTVFLSKISIY